MSLWGAFTNSSMAMSAQSHALGQISTNVTNVNTTGYKQVDTNFKTLLSETTANWDFFGTKPVDYRRVSKQGLTQQTGRSMDVAINGMGMFMVNSQRDVSGETLYTRDGSFETQVDTSTGNAYLTTANGYYLMGWPADEAAYLAGNNPFPANDPSTGSVVGGAAPGPIQLQSASSSDGEATTSAVLRGNIDASARTTQTLGLAVWGDKTTVTNADGTTSSTWPRQNVAMQFEPDLSKNGTWSLKLGDANGGTGTATPSALVFDGSGHLTVPADGKVTFDMTYGNGTTGSISVDISELTQFSGRTKTDKTEINGYPEGTLSGTSFDETGVLTGTFTNGTSRPLYKLALADFVSDDRLELRNQNLYGATAEAGDRRVLSVTGGTNGGTHLTAGALELSNVDLTDQFSRMITTQKAYSSAANVFRTADEMSQTATGMKR